MLCEAGMGPSHDQSVDMWKPPKRRCQILTTKTHQCQVKMQLQRAGISAGDFVSFFSITGNLHCSRKEHDGPALAERCATACASAQAG